MSLQERIINHYYDSPKLKDILTIHSWKVAEKALEICDIHPGLMLDKEMVETAAMLHDIGIIRCDAGGIECFGTEPYICHGRIGANMLRQDAALFGVTAEEIEVYARVCERHTGAGLTQEQIINQGLPLPPLDYLPETTMEKVICYADKFFSKTHPEREKTLEKVIKSLQKFGDDGVARFMQWHKRFSVET